MKQFMNFLVLIGFFYLLTIAAALLVSVVFPFTAVLSDYVTMRAEAYFNLTED